jgi:hypothetical protein
MQCRHRPKCGMVTLSLLEIGVILRRMLSRYTDVVTTKIEIGVVVKQVPNLDTTAMQED